MDQGYFLTSLGLHDLSVSPLDDSTMSTFSGFLFSCRPDIYLFPFGLVECLLFISIQRSCSLVSEVAS